MSSPERMRQWVHGSTRDWVARDFVVELMESPVAEFGREWGGGVGYPAAEFIRVHEMRSATLSAGGGVEKGLTQTLQRLKAAPPMNVEKAHVRAGDWVAFAVVSAETKELVGLFAVCRGSAAPPLPADMVGK